MKNWYLKLNSDLKTCLWSAIIIVSATILTLPLGLINLFEIPLGIIIGGGINTLFYLASGLNRNRGEEKDYLKLDVALMIIRFALFAAVALVIGWLYYKENIKVINLFATVGAYIFPIILYAIISRKERRL